MDNIVVPAVPKRGVTFDRPTRGRLTVGGKGPNQLRLEREAMPGYGVEGSPGQINPWRPTPRGRLHTQFKGGGIAKRGTGAAYKKGGRVTGIAKRGFGRALMKGKK